MVADIKLALDEGFFGTLWTNCLIVGLASFVLKSADWATIQSPGRGGGGGLGGARVLLQ